MTRGRKNELQVTGGDVRCKEGKKRNPDEYGGEGASHRMRKGSGKRKKKPERN